MLERDDNFQINEMLPVVVARVQWTIGERGGEKSWGRGQRRILVWADSRRLPGLGDRSSSIGRLNWSTTDVIVVGAETRSSERGCSGHSSSSRILQSSWFAKRLVNNVQMTAVKVVSGQERMEQPYPCRLSIGLRRRHKIACNSTCLQMNMDTHSLGLWKQ